MPIFCCVQRAAMRGVGREVLDVQLPGDHEIVVAGEAHLAGALGQLHALVGLGAVAHQVAEAPGLVDGGAADVVEHGPEGRQIGVNV